MKDWREYQKDQKIIEIKEGFISYAEYGANHSENVVCIHGIPTWGYIFYDLALGLAAERRVLIPDLMGFGFSSKADTFDRGIDKQANYLLQWMDKLNLENVSLIAHDIGGGVALRLAVLHPARFTAVCLMNSVSYDSWPIELMIQLGHPLMKKLSPKLVRGVLQQALKQGFSKTPSKEVMEGILAPWSTDVGLISLIRNAAALNTNLTTELTVRLPSMNIPTLLLWGKEDKFQDLKYARRLKSDIRQSRLQEIADARHWVMLDQPDIVQKEITKFLAAPQSSYQKNLGTEQSLSLGS